MARTEHVIWQSSIDIKNWEYDKDELIDIGRLEEGQELDEDKIYELANEDNSEYINDERMNLDIRLGTPIIVIGNLGLWNGRVKGYKMIDSGNIKDILYSDDDDIKWYSDGYNIKGIGYHHDGTNYYEYRQVRNMDNIDNFKAMLYGNEEISRRTINYYTKSIVKHVNDVYGW